MRVPRIGPRGLRRRAGTRRRARWVLFWLVAGALGTAGRWFTPWVAAGLRR